MEGLFGQLTQLIQTNPWIAPGASFVGGALTASNPCVLAMIPLMLAFVGGYGNGFSWHRGLIFSVFFVLGLGVTFAILGILAALTGRLLGDVGGFWPFVVAGVCMLMGLHLVGVIRWDWSILPKIHPAGGGLAGAFFLGLLFGLVSTPCATPILAVLLVLTASKGNPLYGGSLLLCYALGHSILVVIAGTSMGAVQRLISSQNLQSAGTVLRRAAGILMILVGFLFVWSAR